MARRYLRDFDHGSHSVYMLYYHLVFCVKYRKKVLNDKIIEVFKSSFIDISRRFDVRLEAINGEPDHIHMMITTKPTTRMSEFIGQLKGRTSHDILKEFPNIKNIIGRDGVLWSPSYCLLTTGGAPIEVIRKYIERQEGFDFENDLKD